MTTTPNEPIEDPDITPAGDPDSAPQPVNPGDDPDVDPAPDTEPTDGI